MRKTKPVMKLLEPTKERIEKARILSVLETERHELIHAARQVADILYQANKQPVTAGQIFEAMASVSFMKPLLAKHDKRWLGAVFTQGWTRVGFSMTGSHCRPVSQWIPTEHCD